MLEKEKLCRNAEKIIDTDQLVPPDHLLRRIDAAVDFEHLYDFVEKLYCEDNGRPTSECGPGGTVQNRADPASARDSVSAADAAYKTRVFDDGRVLPTAYKRLMTKAGNLEWRKYVYDEY